MKEDKEIQDWFIKVKEIDAEKLEIPAFETMINRTSNKKIRLWVPVGIAASLSIIVFVTTLILPGENQVDSPGDTIVLMGNTEDDSYLLFDEPEEVSFSDWKSPTSSLIDDF